MINFWVGFEKRAADENPFHPVGVGLGALAGGFLAGSVSRDFYRHPAAVALGAVAAGALLGGTVGHLAERQAHKASEAIIDKEKERIPAVREIFLKNFNKVLEDNGIFTDVLPAAYERMVNEREQKNLAINPIDRELRRDTKNPFHPVGVGLGALEGGLGAAVMSRAFHSHPAVALGAGAAGALLGGMAGHLIARQGHKVREAIIDKEKERLQALGDTFLKTTLKDVKDLEDAEGKT